MAKELPTRSDAVAAAFHQYNLEAQARAFTSAVTGYLRQKEMAATVTDVLTVATLMARKVHPHTAPGAQ